MIVAVPLPVIQRHGVEFEPALSDEKSKSMTRLDMIPGLKVILKFDQLFWPTDLAYLNGLPSSIVWPAEAGRRGAEPVLTGYAVGSHAAHARAADGGAIAAVLRDLDSVFDGRASKHLVDSYLMDWTEVPSIGGYFAGPTTEHYLDDKAALAEPIGGRLFFAGEATNTDCASMGYVHGAMQTGRRAAMEVLEAQGI